MGHGHNCKNYQFSNNDDPCCCQNDNYNIPWHIRPRFRFYDQSAWEAANQLDSAQNAAQSAQYWLPSVDPEAQLRNRGVNLGDGTHFVLPARTTKMPSAMFAVDHMQNIENKISQSSAKQIQENAEMAQQQQFAQQYPVISSIVAQVKQMYTNMVYGNGDNGQQQQQNKPNVS